MNRQTPQFFAAATGTLNPRFLKWFLTPTLSEGTREFILFHKFSNAHFRANKMELIKFDWKKPKN